MVKLSSIKQNPSKRVNVHDSSGKLEFLSINLFGGKNKRFGDKVKDRFFTELSLLLESGIDIHTAFEIISEGTVNEFEKHIYQSIKSSIVAGVNLHYAINHADKFSQYDVASIKIGEETGQLPIILKELAKYYSRKIMQQRLIFKAISYPIVVLLTALSALIFMLSYVVPMFEDVFFRANKELPLFTQYIVNLSSFFRHYSVYLIVALIVAFLFLLNLRNSIKIKRLFERILINTPIVGPLVKLFFFEKLYHSLALLIRAKVPVHESLELVREIIKFSPINDALNDVCGAVMAGESLANSMSKTKFFDKRSIVLIKIGEEVNKLDDIFERLYQQTSDNLEHQISQFGSTLEPLLIIIVGAFVAMILVAMYLPIFQMGTSVF